MDAVCFEEQYQDELKCYQSIIFTRKKISTGEVCNTQNKKIKASIGNKYGISRNSSSSHLKKIK